MTQNINAICEECDEAISNPICPGCIEKEIAVWLEEMGKESLILKIKERMNLLKKQSEESESSVACILCKKNFSICPHCISVHLAKALQKEKRILNRFLALFSYVY